MHKFTRRVVGPAALAVLATTVSLGVGQSAPPAVHNRAAARESLCISTVGRTHLMDHGLWVLLRRDVRIHYASWLRAGVWRHLTSNPATAFRAVTRMSRIRVSTTCHSATPSIQLLAASGGNDPSGVAMPIGDTPGWHQVFADNFSTSVPLGQFPSAVSSSWGGSYPDGWSDTTGHGTYMPSKTVSISGGLMNIYLHTVNGVHMVAAPVPNLNGPGPEGGLLYGKFVVRFRADAVQGYKTAWLLWPDSEVWPRDGEIDFPEGDLTGSINAYVHHQGATDPTGADQTSFTTSTGYTSWHTATITWLPTGVTFELDGRTLGTTTSRIPDTPMHLVLQTETSTDGPTPPNNASGRVQIDWVTAYSAS